MELHQRIIQALLSKGRPTVRETWDLPHIKEFYLRHAHIIIKNMKLVDGCCPLGEEESRNDYCHKCSDRLGLVGLAFKRMYSHKVLAGTIITGNRDRVVIPQQNDWKLVGRGAITDGQHCISATLHISHKEVVELALYRSEFSEVEERWRQYTQSREA